MFIILLFIIYLYVSLILFSYKKLTKIFLFAVLIVLM